MAAAATAANMPVVPLSDWAKSAASAVEDSQALVPEERGPSALETRPMDSGRRRSSSLSRSATPESLSVRTS